MIQGRNPKVHLLTTMTVYLEETQIIQIAILDATGNYLRYALTDNIHGWKSYAVIPCRQLKLHVFS